MGRCGLHTHLLSGWQILPHTRRSQKLFHRVRLSLLETFWFCSRTLNMVLIAALLFFSFFGKIITRVKKSQKVSDVQGYGFTSMLSDCSLVLSMCLWTKGFGGILQNCSTELVDWKPSDEVLIAGLLFSSVLVRSLGEWKKSHYANNVLGYEFSLMLSYLFCLCFDELKDLVVFDETVPLGLFNLGTFWCSKNTVIVLIAAICSPQFW